MTDTPKEPEVWVGKEMDIVSRGGVAMGGGMFYRPERRIPVTVIEVTATTFTTSNGEVWPRTANITGATHV